jgi:hypothetical protein
VNLYPTSRLFFVSGLPLLNRVRYHLHQVSQHVRTRKSLCHLQPGKARLNHLQTDQDGHITSRVVCYGWTRPMFCHVLQLYIEQPPFALQPVRPTLTILPSTGARPVQELGETYSRYAETQPHHCHWRWRVHPSAHFKVTFPPQIVNGEQHTTVYSREN